MIRRRRSCSASVDDPSTRFAVSTERAFLAELGAGCTLPLGAHCLDGQLYGYLASGADLAVGTVVFRDTVDVTSDAATASAVATAMARRARATVGE